MYEVIILLVSFMVFTTHFRKLLFFFGLSIDLELIWE